MRSIFSFCCLVVVLDVTPCVEFARDEAKAAFMTSSSTMEINFSQTESVTQTVSSMNSSCDSDNEVFRNNLDKCMKKGHRFVRKYLRWMKENIGDFDKCKITWPSPRTLLVEFRSTAAMSSDWARLFHTFVDCINPILDDCPSIRHVFEDNWGLIYQQYYCTCNRKEEDIHDCGLAEACMEDQYATLFLRRCDALTEFNLDQGTRNKCVFLLEGLHCKDTLLTSACGDHSGHLIFDLSRLSIKKKLEASGCDTRRDIHHEGFRYTVQCPVNFPQHFNTCYEESFRQHVLSFNPDNDLVASAGRRDVKRACRSLSSYRRCVAALGSSCVEGSNKVYELNSKARTYLLKMEFICDNAQDEYARQLLCYQEVLHNRTLERCGPVWDKLQPVLHSLTAVQFYCITREPKATFVHSALAELRHCYGDVYRSSCGPEGSWVMNTLMQLAFKDPFYMHFRFRPDCAFHGLETHNEFEERRTNYSFIGEQVKPNRPPETTLNNGICSMEIGIWSKIVLFILVKTWLCSVNGYVHR